MLYNKGNHAQLKRVQPQPSRLQGENGGKIYSTWNPGFKNTTINEYGFSTIDKISKVIEQIEEEIS